MSVAKVRERWAQSLPEKVVKAEPPKKEPVRAPKPRRSLIVPCDVCKTGGAVAVLNEPNKRGQTYFCAAHEDRATAPDARAS